jgi:putative ABC transport system permease protein
VTERRGPAKRGGRRADPLWSKAPLVLLRFPRVLVALLVGCILLTLAAAGYPLLLSARTTKLLHERVEDPAVTVFGAGITYQTLPQPRPLGGVAPAGESAADVTSAFERRTNDPALGPVVRTELGPPLPLSTAGTTSTGPLFAGDGAFDHVAVLVPPRGEGVWLSELTARALGVGRGDDVTLGAPDGGRTVAVRVAAIYRARVGEPRSPYFQAWDQQIYPLCPIECPVPPPFVLAAPPTFDTLRSELGFHGVARAWQAPVRGDLTLDDARRVGALAQRLQSEAGRPDTDLPCCRPYLGDQGAMMPRLASSMPAIVRLVEGEAAGIGGPGRLLQVAAVAVAIVVVGVAAGLAHAARRTEFRLLYSRGVGAGTVAARSALETVVPAAASGAAGLAIGLAVVPFVGAGARASSSALASAVLTALGAAVVACAVVALVSSVAYARHGDAPGPLGRLAVRAPWELAMAAGAALAFATLRSGGAFEQNAASGVRVPTLAVLAFPVLATAAAATLLARLSVLAIARIRTRTQRSAPWLFVAVRRLGSDAGSTMLFVAAAAVCLGIFVLAQTVVGSLRDTVEAKARLFVGSDVHATIQGGAPEVGPFPYPITRVTRVSAGATLVPGGAQVDLLAIDPATFARAAFWRSGLSPTPLDELVRRIAEARGPGVPVVVAGHDPNVTGLVVGGTEVDVSVVGSASAFPGMASGHALVAVPADRFSAALAGHANALMAPGASTELWVRGPTSGAVSALRHLRYPPSDVVTADEVADIPHIAIVVDTFSMLEVLGTLAAVLVVASVLLYLQARQRAQLVSYGLSLRMGMGDASQRRALLAEVASVLGVAFALALGVAIAVSAALVPLLDPIPAIPPDPFLDLPVARIVVAFVAIVGCAWLAAVLTNAAARSSDLGQVMRGVE